LNLGCPQRVAHAGHFGSFLLDDEDRDLVLNIVRTVSSGLTIPMFVKIRLLETVEKTIIFCQQLIDAGAALIAIHARHRVSLVGRSGPTARDGPALLDQVQVIKKTLAHTGVPIIANGNVITWSDVQSNLQFTHADGIMSAEGILDDPAIFFESSPDGLANKEKPTALRLALEYLDLVTKHEVTLKCCIFHVRRMCKKQFEKYQLLEECLTAQSVESVRAVVLQAIEYETKGNYVTSSEKALKQKEAMERKKREEGKRKQYEERMTRKAKREGKPLDFYLRVGVEPPTVEDLAQLKSLTKEEGFAKWKENFGQHCFSFHFERSGCPRERTCAFLHMDASYAEDPKFG
jgi:tRNA-dihydrouridine synthase